MAKSFEDAIKGKKFKNPETGNMVAFTSLPNDEQKKIRSRWVAKNPRGSGGAGGNPKELMKEDSDAYFAQHVSGEISKKKLTDALKGTGFAPRGKGSFDKKTKSVFLLLDPTDKEDRGSPLKVYLSGSYMTEGDETGHISIQDISLGTSDDHRHDLTGDPKKDSENMLKSIRELAEDAQEYRREYRKSRKK